MAVFRINKTTNYTIMSNFHFKEKGMSLKAKGLLSLMLSLPENWDFSVSGLVSLCKENETAINSTLKELKQFGYLFVTKLMPNQTKSGRIEYIYDIYEQPLKILKQEGKKQALENQGVVFQGVENQGQLNTKELNTNKYNYYPNGYAENYIGVCNKLQRGGQGVDKCPPKIEIELEKEKDNKYIAEQVLCYLNEKANKHYKAIESNLKFITARLKDYNEADLKAVIDKKVVEWKGTDMERFLRPETLFNATKFESYVNAPLRKVVKGDESQHFDGEREYSKQEIQGLMTDIDDIDF